MSDRIQSATRACSKFPLRTALSASLLIGLGGCAASSDPSDLDPVSAADEDTARAALIVDGEIVELRTFETVGDGPFTLARVAVGRVVHGKPGSDVLTIHVLGGRIGDVVTLASSNPTLEDGERARFYLEPIDRESAGVVQAQHEAPTWSEHAVLYRLRNGERGKVALIDASAGAGELGVTRQALTVRGCAPGDGYCFASIDPVLFGNAPMRYRINPNTSDTTGIVSAVQMGFAAWEAEPASRIDFQYDGLTSSTAVENDGVNNVFWTPTVQNNDAARTWQQILWAGTSTTLLGWDLTFNDSIKWGVFSDQLIEHTAMHEAGHSIGFDHYADVNQIMRNPATSRIKLGTGDRRGARELYRGAELAAIGDFNGDNKDDIVTFVNGETYGAAWVAIQGSNTFNAASVWHSGIYVPGSQVLVGRFNADNKDDIAIVGPIETGSAVIVCTSLGNAFTNCAFWTTNFPETMTQRAGDVNGDGKDDLVGFTQGVTGQVYVSLSTGSGFGPAQLWASAWIALGAEVPLLGDVDSDGDDDAIVYGNGASSDSVWVLRSNRTSFDAATSWKTGFCPAGSTPIVGDFDSLGAVDAGCMVPDLQSILYAPSVSGTRFGSTRTIFGSGFPSRNRSVFVGRFNEQGGILRFDHCSSADVFVWRYKGIDATWQPAAKWHDFFAPGPCP